MDKPKSVANASWGENKMQQGVSCTIDIGLGGCRPGGGGGGFGGRVGPGHPGCPILWGLGAVLTQGLLMLVFLKA